MPCAAGADRAPPALPPQSPCCWALALDPAGLQRLGDGTCQRHWPGPTGTGCCDGLPANRLLSTVASPRFAEPRGWVDASQLTRLSPSIAHPLLANHKPVVTHGLPGPWLRHCCRRPLCVPFPAGSSADPGAARPDLPLHFKLPKPGASSCTGLGTTGPGRATAKQPNLPCRAHGTKLADPPTSPWHVLSIHRLSHPAVPWPCRGTPAPQTVHHTRQRHQALHGALPGSDGPSSFRHSPAAPSTRRLLSQRTARPRPRHQPAAAQPGTGGCRRAGTAPTACPARQRGSHPGKANAPTLMHQGTVAGAAGTTRRRGQRQPAMAHTHTYAPIHSTVAPNQSSPAPATLNVAVCSTAGSAPGLRRWRHQPPPTTSCASEWVGGSHPQTPWGSPTRARGSLCPGQVLQPGC